MTWWGRQNFVTVTHEPTGLQVTADYSRSNVRCRAACMSMLRGQLWSLEHGADQPEPTDAQRTIADSILARIQKPNT